ncbi:MAG: flap structure-specific endonuclease, partial [Candidatus Heimdallarchaeota archaeon]|nr:flap structure-specific endonuclease [Candidatus Heimdallarchaeota archaeon]
FGSPKLIRNLNIVGRRRLPNGQTKIIYPEQYQLSTVLQTLNLSQEQLIDLGILMGTDFNKGFVKVGPKTAFKFISKYGSFEKVRKNEEKINSVEVPYETIKGIFLNPNVEKNLSVDFDQEYDPDAIKQFLSDKNFDMGRYENLLKKTHSDIKRFQSQTQTSLDDWF